MRDDITLADLWQILRERWWVVIAGTVLSTALAVFIAFTSKPVYRAEAVLAPVSENQNSGGLSSLASQFSGIASLVGVTLDPGNDRRTEALAVLRSRALTRAFVEDNDLLPILFSEQWDTKKEGWKSDDPKKIPTLWDADQLFASKIRKVSEDRDAGLVTVAIEWSDPELAAKWVMELIERTNAHLRKAAIERSERNIAYLEKQANSTSVVELRQSIYRLIEGEINTIMLAQGSEDYAFRVIDPAVVPQEPVRPKRPMIIAVGFASGVALSCVFLLFFAEPRRS